MQNNNNDLATNANDLASNGIELIEKGMAMIPEIVAIIAGYAAGGAPGAAAAAITASTTLIPKVEAFFKEAQEVFDSAKKTGEALVNTEGFKKIVEQAKELEKNFIDIFDGDDKGKKILNALADTIGNIGKIAEQAIQLTMETSKSIDFSKISGLADAAKEFANAIKNPDLVSAKAQSEKITKEQGQNGPVI